MNVGLIGAGNIGSVLYRRLQRLGWNIQFVLRSDGVYRDLRQKIDRLENFPARANGVQLVFLAIPTFDDGTTACQYLRHFLERNIPVVTCEKGALANYFSQLESFKDNIGYRATVGGGTRLLQFLEDHVGPGLRQIHAVINGTLNYLLHAVAIGKSFNAAIAEVQRHGYAEPGVVNPLAIVNEEATRDAVMKTAIMFNVANLTPRRLRALDVKVKEIGDAELTQLIHDANRRRFIVSISRDELATEDTIGGFAHDLEGWTISAGFKAVDSNPAFADLILPGVTNGIIMQEGSDGTYRMTGPGGGAMPTTSAMLKDATQLFGQRIAGV